MSLFDSSSAFSSCLENVEKKIDAAKSNVERKAQQQIRRVLLAFAEFVDSMGLETPIDTVVKDSDTIFWLFSRYLVLIVKDSGAKTAHRTTWALRQIAQYWQEEELTDFDPSALRTPSNPPAEPAFEWLDLWSEELERRYMLGFDEDAQPLPQWKLPQQAISRDRVFALRGEFIALLRFALEELDIDCVLGETDPELVWKEEQKENTPSPDEALAEVLRDGRGKLLRRYLYGICLSRSTATVQGAASNLRALVEYLYAEGLCDFPPSRLRTPSKEPEFPDFEFVDSWFDEVDRREALGAKRRSGPKVEPDAIAREFAQLLRRVFRSYLKFGVEQHGVELSLTTDGIVVCWSDDNKAGDAANSLEKALLSDDGELARAFIDAEAQRVSKATVRTTAAALRTALDHLRRNGFSNFDPSELKTPGGAEIIRTRPTREPSSKSARLPKKKRKVKRKGAKKVAKKATKKKVGIAELFSIKVRRRSSVEEPDAETLFTSRDSLIQELICSQSSPLNFTEVYFLRRKWYQAETGTLRYLAGEHIGERKMRTTELSESLRLQLSQYLELVEISAYSTHWRENSESRFGLPLFFASDGGNLVADDCRGGEEYQAGYFHTRDMLVTTLIRRLGLSLAEVVGLTRRSIDENSVRVHQTRTLDEETSKALRAWLQIARISGVSWDGAEDQLPLLMGTDFDTLIP